MMKECERKAHFPLEGTTITGEETDDRVSESVGIQLSPSFDQRRNADAEMDTTRLRRMGKFRKGRSAKAKSSSEHQDITLAQRRLASVGMSPHHSNSSATRKRKNTPFNPLRAFRAADD